MASGEKRSYQRLDEDVALDGTLRISEALGQMPWPVWQRVVEEEPEFQRMKPLSQRYPPGPFLTLMVVAGLNDYQLKGRAEVAYWPPLSERLENTSVPTSPEDLARLLQPFYYGERLGATKVRRLRRFLHSSLAQKLWTMTPSKAAKQVRALWQQTAATMGQAPSAKTIAFSAKTLAIALLLLEETGFDFRDIPVPADLRLQRLTPQLSEQGIREFWDVVLARLHQSEKRLTHVHLDSFLWQYAGAGDPRAYLGRLGVSESPAVQIVKGFSALATLAG